MTEEKEQQIGNWVSIETTEYNRDQAAKVLDKMKEIERKYSKERKKVVTKVNNAIITKYIKK